jgi:flavin-dependent dehydrogenase
MTPPAVDASSVDGVETPIAATLGLEAAAAAAWHAVVAGAGPAGASAAIRLARAGLRVLLVDRGSMPRPKVCGCCLSVAAVRELDGLELTDSPRGLPLELVDLAAGGRSARIPLPGGRVISRESLDPALVRAAIKAGCHWLPQTTLEAVEDDGATAVTGRLLAADLGDAGGMDGRRIVLAGWFIVAAGLADAVRGGDAEGRRVAAGSRIGLGTLLGGGAADLPDGDLVMAVGRGGYCGLVRLADGRIDLAAAVDRTAVAAAGPAAAVLAILEESLGHARAAIIAAEIRRASFRATPPLTRAAPLVAGVAGRILRVGDAAGYVEPFTGEGIGWALASGRIAAASIVSGGGATDSVEVAARYRAAHAAHFGPLHARCRRVSLALRRPALVAAAVRAARAVPWVARRLVPTIIGAGPSPNVTPVS